MKTLRMVIEPHPATDAAKVASLVNAYLMSIQEISRPDADTDPSPVVVLILGDAPYALSGSHRLAALRQVYPGDEPIEDMDEILCVDGDARGIYIHADAVGREALDRILDGRYSPADDLDAIRGLLPRRAREALEGQ